MKLAVVIDKGRLEDVMRLAVNSDKPPMTGGLRLETNFVIPAGEMNVVDKLRLDGTLLDRRRPVHECRRAAEDQRDEPARERQAREGVQGPAADRAAARRLRLSRGGSSCSDGVLRIPTLVFDIPGAAVKLTGTYSLRRETIAFAGNLYMDAKVSQTVTGWKSMAAEGRRSAVP